MAWSIQLDLRFPFTRVLLAAALVWLAGCVPMVTRMADSPPVNGIVIDGETGEPLEGVPVAAQPRELDPGPETVTDAGGRFELPERSRLKMHVFMPGLAYELVPVMARPDDRHVGYGGARKVLAQRVPASLAYTTIVVLPDRGEREVGTACKLTGRDAYVVQFVESLPVLQERAWFRQRFVGNREAGRQLTGMLGRFFNVAKQRCGMDGYSELKLIRENLSAFEQTVYN